MVLRSMTRAAEALGLSQPAVSNALARLRKLMGDELFLRTPSGMEPTPYAEQLTRQSQSASVLDGRSPDTQDAAFVAHEPVVTITQSPGFQWGDFGIGTGVAVAAMILLALSLRFLSNRQDRKAGSVATA